MEKPPPIRPAARALRSGCCRPLNLRLDTADANILIAAATATVVATVVAAIVAGVGTTAQATDE